MDIPNQASPRSLFVRQESQAGVYWPYFRDNPSPSAVRTRSDKTLGLFRVQVSPLLNIGLVEQQSKHEPLHQPVEKSKIYPEILIAAEWIYF